MLYSQNVGRLWSHDPEAVVCHGLLSPTVTTEGEKYCACIRVLSNDGSGRGAKRLVSNVARG